jgi:PRC-barrel domain
MRRPILAAAAALLLAGPLAGPSSGEEQKSSQGPSVTVIGSRQAEGILGRQVRSRTNENIGRIVDVIVDHTGRTRAAVIDFGGFLGIGNRKIAVDWDALSFVPDIEGRDVVTLELTRDQIKAAPLYRDRRAVIVIGAAGSLPPTP